VSGAAATVMEKGDGPARRIDALTN